MPVFALDDKLVFPDPDRADASGLLAIGGDLSIERLVLAYSLGIFPWYSEGDPIMWWSPHPRFILTPRDFNLSKSLRQNIRNTTYEISFDKCFIEVIEHCSKVPRRGQPGTWITGEMKKAYVNLHEAGFAHSVETYQEGILVGGLYGVSLGKAFFGESMFFLKSNASKIAFYHLVNRLKKWEFHIIDAQVETEHMKRLGARAVSRPDFLSRLNEALKFPTKKGKW